MVVKKRQLRERKFVSYVQNRVRIQKAKIPEPKRRGSLEASETGSAASLVRSQNRLRSSRTIYPPRRYTPDASPSISRQSSSGRNSNQDKVDKASATSAHSSANTRCKVTPISSRLRTRSTPPPSKAPATPRRQTLFKKTAPHSRSLRSNTRSSEVLAPTFSDFKTTSENKSEKSKILTPEQDESYDFDLGSESRNKESSEDEESESDITTDDDEDKSSKSGSRRCSDVEIGEYPKLEASDFSFGNYLSSFSSPFEQSRVPSEFHEMKLIWAKLGSLLPAEMLLAYKSCLRDLLTGRVSSLNSISRLVPGFPPHLVSTHNNLYELLCQASGAYPFKNHEGTTLVSRHCLADTCQIGAQIMLECLDNGLLPFDPTVETTILSQIRTYVRIGIKDMLQELVEQLPKDRNTITVSDLKESLVSRLLK